MAERSSRQTPLRRATKGPIALHAERMPSTAHLPQPVARRWPRGVLMPTVRSRCSIEHRRVKVNQEHAMSNRRFSPWAAGFASVMTLAIGAGIGALAQVDSFGAPVVQLERVEVIGSAPAGNAQTLLADQHAVRRGAL
jgi:hypothetical protein